MFFKRWCVCSADSLNHFDALHREPHWPSRPPLKSGSCQFFTDSSWQLHLCGRLMSRIFITTPIHSLTTDKATKYAKSSPLSLGWVSHRADREVEPVDRSCCTTPPCLSSGQNFFHQLLLLPLYHPFKSVVHVSSELTESCKIPRQWGCSCCCCCCCCCCCSK